MIRNFDIVCKDTQNAYDAINPHIKAEDEEKWITIGAGENEYGERTGRHVKIDENGMIVGGSLPKSAQGKPINSWWTSSSAKEVTSKTMFKGKKPLIVNTYYRRSGRYWKDSMLEATKGNEPGEIEIGYPSKMDWENTGKQKNTEPVTITINAGFQNGEPYNLNFDNITKISGKTYGLSDVLKGKGFEWDGKEWIKKDALEKQIKSTSISLPRLTGSEKQIAWAEKIRMGKLSQLKTISSNAKKRLLQLGEITEDQKRQLISQYGEPQVIAEIKHQKELAENDVKKYEDALKQEKASWWIDNR